MTTYHLDIQSSATRHIPDINSEVKTEYGYGKMPQIGDVVIGAITKVGQHLVIEDPLGQEIVIHPGHICALVLGRRYSTSEFYGELPCKLKPNDEFSLLNVGGIAGEVKEKNALAMDPTTLTYLGHACTQEGKRLNTFDYAPCFLPPPALELPIILVIGTDMDCGKTTTCGLAIRILTDNGWRVGAGKLTGTSRMKDIFHMKARGAKWIADFMDLGFPSTSGCSIEELESIWLGLRSILTQKDCQILVLEVADGIFQPQTELILSNRRIVDECSILILSADRSLSAFGAIDYLMNRYKKKPNFLSGLITNSKLSITELSSKVDITVLSNGWQSQKSFIESIERLKYDRSPH